MTLVVNAYTYFCVKNPCFYWCAYIKLYKALCNRGSIIMVRKNRPNRVFLKDGCRETLKAFMARKTDVDTQVKLAFEAKVGRSTVQNFFSYKNVDRESAEAILKPLGIHENDFDSYLVPEHVRRYEAQSKAKSEELSPMAMHTSAVQIILEQEPDFSSSPVPGEPLHPLSPFQIIDTDAEEELLEKLEYGSQAIRIKGPHRSGKTTLLCRVCHRFIEQHPDEPVTIAYLGLDDPLQAPDTILSQHREFAACLMRTINNSVENSIDPLPDISNSWNPNGVFDRCLGKLLDTNSGKIIIVLDGLEELFQHPQTLKSYEPFFKFLDNKKISKPYNRVRTIFVNSTDEYVATHHVASPLNVGHVVEISWLNKRHKDAIRKLIQAYELPVDDNKCIDEMLSFFGGMPYFIHKALREAKSRGIPLSNVLELFRAPKSIFSSDLLPLIDSIRDYDAFHQGSDLRGGLKKIVNSDGFVLIDDESSGINYITARLLESLGVVTIYTHKPGEQRVVVNSELYRLFFQRFVW